MFQNQNETKKKGDEKKTIIHIQYVKSNEILCSKKTKVKRRDKKQSWKENVTEYWIWVALNIDYYINIHGSTVHNAYLNGFVRVFVSLTDFISMFNVQWIVWPQYVE